MSANASLSRKLRFGPYAALRFRYESTAVNDARGGVVVVALSAGPNTVAARPPKGQSSRGLILYRDLARAVRREASQAVAYWWGVSAFTVWKWRKALGINEQTEGERALRVEHGRRNWPKVGPKLLSKAQHPERRAKISAALNGRKRPNNVAAAVRKANTGRTLTAVYMRRSALKRIEKTAATTISNSTR